MKKSRLYLDYNATTPLMEQARGALADALELFGNPSSVHEEGRAARALLQQARRDVAALVGAQAEWVVFTSGATEAAVTLLTPHYFMGRTPLLASHAFIGATEHPCILAGGQFSPRDMTIIPVFARGRADEGQIDAGMLEDLLQHHDFSQGLPLVCIQYANHETGIIQDIQKIGKLVKNAGGLLIVDAVQAAGKETIRLAETGADFFILSAHKMGAAKGAGAIVAAGPLVMPRPLLTGGGQEQGHRSGTQALPLIAAFAAACTHALTNQPQERKRLFGLQQNLEAGIRDICSQTIIYGADEARLANTTCFTIPGMSAETLQIALDLEGIAVSNGSACSSGKVGISPVLKAMGVAQTDGAIRVSTGVDTHESDIKYFLQVLRNILLRSGKKS